MFFKQSYKGSLNSDITETKIIMIFSTYHQNLVSSQAHKEVVAEHMKLILLKTISYQFIHVLKI